MFDDDDGRCYCDHPEPVVYGRTERRAAKRHACVECSHVIERGAVYTEHRGLWEDQWSTVRQCQRCARVFDRLAREDCCVPLGEMRKALRERLGRHRSFGRTA